MKILFKISFILILLGILTLNSNCKKNIFKKITYEGYVYDSIGGSPHAWVTVKLRACSSKTAKAYCDTYEVGSSVTDVNGHFYIHAASPVNERYHVEVGHTYYDPYLFSVTEADLKTETYTILYLNHIP